MAVEIKGTSEIKLIFWSISRLAPWKAQALHTQALESLKSSTRCLVQLQLCSGAPTQLTATRRCLTGVPTIAGTPRGTSLRQLKESVGHGKQPLSCSPQAQQCRVQAEARPPTSDGLPSPDTAPAACSPAEVQAMVQHSLTCIPLCWPPATSVLLQSLCVCVQSKLREITACLSPVTVQRATTWDDKQQNIFLEQLLITSSCQGNAWSYEHLTVLSARKIQSLLDVHQYNNLTWKEISDIFLPTYQSSSFNRAIFQITASVTALQEVLIGKLKTAKIQFPPVYCNLWNVVLSKLRK